MSEENKPDAAQPEQDSSVSSTPPEQTPASEQGAPIPPPPQPQAQPQYAQPQDQYTQQPNYQYPPAQPQQQSSRTQGIGSPQKEKWVAAVLAFVLGTLGIHKFYLGYKNEGIIMLVVSLVGSLCFGLGPLVMFVISLIEAVKYVTLTQADFERIYVLNSKSWF
jgi:TM2 domain-containing membrane protein YozV